MMAAANHPKLTDLTDPKMGTLASLWISCLRDQALIRINIEFGEGGSIAAASSSIDLAIEECQLLNSVSVDIFCLIPLKPSSILKKLALGSCKPCPKGCIKEDLSSLEH